jgi:hypothetical protein
MRKLPTCLPIAGIGRLRSVPGASQPTTTRPRYWRRAVPLLIAGLCCAQGSAVAAQQTGATSDTQIDQIVQAKLTALYGSTDTILAHIDLTAAFATKSPWAVVVTKANHPDAAMLRWEVVDDAGNGGPVSICFVKGAMPDCSDRVPPDRVAYGNSAQYEENIRPFYQFLGGRVVYAASGKTKPLLLLGTCSFHGMNGSCGVGTQLYRYDPSGDRFDLAFFKTVPKNLNGVIRFVETGPLQGAVIVAYPTDNAPYTYWVEVYKQDTTGHYKQVLRYRGKTGYGDHNPLSVADSEMPQILHRFGYWKPGDPPPAPGEMPASCKRVFMRGALEWCQ